MFALLFVAVITATFYAVPAGGLGIFPNATSRPLLSNNKTASQLAHSHSHHQLDASTTWFNGSTYNKSRTDQCPMIPARPPWLDNNWFSSIDFDCLGVNSHALAMSAMPVYLFARADENSRTCYPEFAVLLGTTPPKPNPGTDVPAGTNPGKNCDSPGPYHDEFSPGNPFPVYVGASYCPEKNQYRLAYVLYYPHSGTSSLGRKPDWDSRVTTIWKKDPQGSDWWGRHSAIYQKDEWNDFYTWNQLQTVEPNDLRDDSQGRSLSHPKVYVGLFSHSSFRERRVSDKSWWDNEGQESAANYEYRSNDWIYMPGLSDIHEWNEVDGLDYNTANNNMASTSNKGLHICDIEDADPNGPQSPTDPTMPHA